ncbi:Uma2 family endonuclease [Thermocoleostomius sinensis]|uniref:Uma2 family endonuclease n=1 Tax=Thermocoleostomius sinensis A174 TaxID=2016057 RepID=A0A9E8ZHD1_9CYAN|nr:Uma2 family endonuclease [Thermocoleostomius sinensis]WAL61844.1 Uma2 family endonuclease [Thermocoleostomius sinensis A174]
MVSTKVKLWTVDDYHRMVETGILTEGDRVELLEGQIIEMNPQLPPHAATTQRAFRYLDRLLETVAYVRMQLPVTLQPRSEPEPDIAVVHIDANEYGDHHPTPNEIFLIIEVADSTLLGDRQQKAPIYAKAGIPDYWILDVNTRQVYVFREPTQAGYQQQETVLAVNMLLAPVAFPNIAISLNQLFLQNLP